MQKTQPKIIKNSHPAADALDWDEAMSLISNLKEDEYYRDAMLIACGCFLGLRISDILPLKWKDLDNEKLIIKEKKTGKSRILKINPSLKQIANECKEKSNAEMNSFIFNTQMNSGRFPMTRQRAAQILKESAKRYNIKSATVFSTHSLRKTFGRRVWLQECEKGKGELALQLLQDVFGHSSMAITKRYLGIRQDEILSVYDTLSL